jgi:hypothetical protein
MESSGSSCESSFTKIQNFINSQFKNTSKASEKKEQLSRNLLNRFDLNAKILRFSVILSDIHKIRIFTFWKKSITKEETNFRFWGRDGFRFSKLILRNEESDLLNVLNEFFVSL